MSATSIILVAASVFIVTNIDDLFILVAFMSDPTYRLRDVVLGQFLGAAMMTSLCIILAWVAVGASATAFAWLGLLEIGIGAKKLLERREHQPAVVMRRGGEGLPTVTLATIGGFGDNVGAYIPLFATRGNTGLVCTLFAAMTALLCIVAYWFVGRRELRLPDLARRLLPWVWIALGITIVSHAGANVG